MHIEKPWQSPASAGRKRDISADHSQLLRAVFHIIIAVRDLIMRAKVFRSVKLRGDCSATEHCGDKAERQQNCWLESREAKIDSITPPLLLAPRSLSTSLRKPHGNRQLAEAGAKGPSIAIAIFCAQNWIKCRFARRRFSFEKCVRDALRKPSTICAD
jgi:hypothetical protein